MTEDLKMPNNLYEFRKFVFKDLIKGGYKYIARNKGGTIYAFSRKPIRQGKEWGFDRAFDSGNKLKDISLVSCIFTDIEWKDVEPFRIPYTNWKEVPVDTPVVYNSLDGKNYVLHFCKYNEENDRVVLYSSGRTSFTEQGIMETYPERVTIYGEEEELYEQGEALNVLMV